MRKHAFSLVELVVAVVILGVLAAMAIPRLSQGARNNAEDDLKANLAVLRTAIELYHRDHGVYPAQTSARAPGAEAATAGAFFRQLTMHTDDQGRASATASKTFKHGPYLRRGVPCCPLPAEQRRTQVHVITGHALPSFDEAAKGAGWVYNCDTGYIAANAPGEDDLGIRYDSY